MNDEMELLMPKRIRGTAIRPMKTVSITVAPKRGPKPMRLVNMTV